jgi:tetratricopeptide (TPR) repeat protein
VGILGSSLAIFFIKTVLKAKGIAEDDQQGADDSTGDAHLPDATIDMDFFLSDELSIEPILDILKGKDEDFKKGALNFLGRLGTPTAVRLLKRCLTDQNPEVRFYAHSRLTKLEEVHTREIKEALTRVDSGKGERGEQLKHLGKAYKAYTESGLLEDETVDHYMNLAKEALLNSLPLADKDSEIPLILGQLSVTGKDFEDAEKYFKKAAETALNPVEALFGLCEIYYEKGDMSALSETAKKIGRMKNQETGDVDKDILIRFWTTQKSA